MRLNRREKTIVAAGLAVLVVLGLYLIVVEPLVERREELARTTRRLEQDLAEMRDLAAQYQSVARNQEDLRAKVQARGSDFTPFSYLESVAGQSGLTGKIESMSPVVSAPGEGRENLAQFDLRLSGIGLAELVQFLYRLESSEKVFFVENLNIRPRYLTPSELDVSLRLATPRAG